MADDVPPNILGSTFEQDIVQFGSKIEDLENLLKKFGPEAEELLKSYVNDDVFLHNENSTQKMLQCNVSHYEEYVRLGELHPEGFCDAIYDGAMCWPPTQLNTTATRSCFSEFHGIKYDTTNNASKHCMWNGTWDKAYYNFCSEVLDHDGHAVEAETTIYFSCYALSLVALTIAIGIFLYFKDLRCLRNRIHTNLMCAYMGVYFMWILTLLLELSYANNISCIFLIILLHYFHLTTFFWMFVEGLYLYILVVKTLTRENFKLRVYVFIGWVLPLLFVVIWALIKAFMPIETVTEGENTTVETNAGSLWLHCPWMKPDNIDWIHQAPVIVVLIVNLIFLLLIMWVLITKLRSANTLETQQYRKAAKALLVLMPLLGVTYVLTITGPRGDEATKYIFVYARAVLLSTQGFTVALFYCFLNTEVQNTVKHHLETWKTSRSLGQRRLRSESRSKDWSPRSRTESIRLYSQPTYHKRESCTSDITTTTLVTINGGASRSSNGGSSQIRSPFLHPPRPSYPGNV